MSDAAEAQPPVEVLRAGALTTIQDLGRPGWAHLGVPRSGALDQPALRLANALVGNDPGAAGLETTLTGCTLRFAAPMLVAVTGARAVVTLAGRAAPHDTPLRVRPTETLAVGPARSGVRSYVAVSGGINVPPVLGSRSADTLSGLGPSPLRNGDALDVGKGFERSEFLPTDRRVGGVAAALPAVSAAVVMLRVRFGPREDWFAAEATQVLCGSAYTVSVHSNRVGARLAGPALVKAAHADLAGVPPRRVNPSELPSEGLVLGAVQVAADGQPTVMLADHPTTGGYPVIAVVKPDDLALLAQARPGTSVRFCGME